MKSITIHSNKKHKPQYYVTEGSGLKEKTLYESSDASKAIQWAVDYVYEEGVG